MNAQQLRCMQCAAGGQLNPDLQDMYAAVVATTMQPVCVQAMLAATGACVGPRTPLSSGQCFCLCRVLLQAI
jgi:hypothetical protein